MSYFRSFPTCEVTDVFILRRVPTVLVPAPHFDKTNFQEIVESVYVFDECTSVKINTNYCKYLQLITEHRDLFLVSMFSFCRALSSLMLAIWPNSLGSAGKIVVVTKLYRRRKVVFATLEFLR